MIMFSVIMPTYNRGHIIEKAIISVINQTYQNWELIIVDDGSKDSTSQVVFGMADERIRYIRYEKNAGANHARNIGVEKAVGKYLAFLDSDNQWHENYLESQLGAFLDTAADVVFARCVIAGPWGYIVFPDNLYTELSSNEKILKHALYNSVFDTNVVCMKRIVWEHSGKFDENLFRFQDWECFLGILVQGKYQFKFNDAVLCDNCLQQDSVSCKEELFWDSRLYIFEKYIEKCRETGEVINIVLHLLKQSEVNCLLPYQAGKLTGLLSPDEMTELYKKYYEEYAGYCISYHELNHRIEEECRRTKWARQVAEKNERILQIERKWITLKQKGSDAAFLLAQRGMHEIALYGYGVLGRLMLQELKNSSVSVKYIIDRQKIKPEKDMDMPVIMEGLESLKQMKRVDAVVVTAVVAYEEIKGELEENTDVKIISIEEIFDACT